MHRPDEPDLTVLHFSDMHFEDEDVYGVNWEGLEQYREAAYDTLERLGADADQAWFSGDAGTTEDREELEEFLERFSDSATLPGNSDEELEYYEHDEIDDPEDLLENTRSETLDIDDGPTYNILRSHDPRHVGVPPGNMEDRQRYLDPDDDRLGDARCGWMTDEATGDYDIIVTAHKHGEGTFVMEDGSLAVQAGSTADNYITDSEELPDTSVQRLHFDGDEVHVEHIDFQDKTVVEERGYRWTGDRFEELYVDSPWTMDERYS